MTVCPEKPRLAPTTNPDVMEVVDAHLTVVELPFGFSLSVKILPGYMTDGASVPEELRPAFGSPWDMPRLLAALVHDILYSIHCWRCRWLCDLVYRKILVQAGYPLEKVAVEYAAVRADGWKSWEGITKDETRWARKLVSVKVGRTPR